MKAIKFIALSALLLAGASMLAVPADAQRAIGGRGGSSGGSSGGKSVGGSGSAPAIGGSGSSGGSRSVGGSSGGRSSTPAPSPRASTPSTPRSSTPSPSPRASSPSTPRSSTPSPSPRASTPSTPSPAPSPRASTPRSSTPSPAPAPSPRASTPAPSRSTAPRVEDSPPSNARRVNDTYRAPSARNDEPPPNVRRTASGVPDLRKSTEPSRVARDTEPTRRTVEPVRSPTITERPTTARYDFNRATARPAARTTEQVAPPRAFTERSTVVNMRASTPTAWRTTSYSERSYGHGYYGYNWYRPGWFAGWSWHGRWGSLSIGWYFPSYYSCGWGYWPGYYSCGWSSGVYFGSFAVATLVGHAWHITPYPSYYGYYGWGRYCYFPWHSYRRYHRYHWHGISVCVRRPYWYDYGVWWDYRPYHLGYTRYVYENLYDEGYNDGFDNGYDKGYNRGYEDGAESDAYRDARRRDSIHRPARDDKERDRERQNAAEEFSIEMEQGFKAFAAGDYDAAIRAFKEAVILDPASAPAKLNLALAAFASGKYSFAAFGIRRGLAQDPDAITADLRTRYRDREVLARQLADLDDAIAENPDADKLLVSGYIRLLSGDAEGAAKALERAAGYAGQDATVKLLYKAALDRLEK